MRAWGCGQLRWIWRQGRRGPQPHEAIFQKDEVCILNTTWVFTDPAIFEENLFIMRHILLNLLSAFLTFTGGVFTHTRTQSQ